MSYAPLSKPKIHGNSNKPNLKGKQEEAYQRYIGDKADLEAAREYLRASLAKIEQDKQKEFRDFYLGGCSNANNDGQWIAFGDLSGKDTCFALRLSKYRRTIISNGEQHD
jgi:hypothetical protein